MNRQPLSIFLVAYALTFTVACGEIAPANNAANKPVNSAVNATNNEANANSSVYSANSNANTNANKNNTTMTKDLDEKLKTSFKKWCYPGDDNEKKKLPEYDSGTSLSKIWLERDWSPESYKTVGIPRLVSQLNTDFEPCMKGVKKSNFLPGGDLIKVSDLNLRLFDCA